MPNVKLSDLPVAELKKELARREKNQGKLRKQRARLVRQLEAIDRELGEAPVARKVRTAKPGRKAKPAKTDKKVKARPAKAPKAKKPRKRAQNAMTLPEAMRSVMSKDLPMGVKDISTAVTAAGYKSNSKTFDTIIYQALKKDKRFVKASRGRYVLGE